MQINIGRRSAVIIGVFILVAAGVISLSINKSDSDDMGGMSDHSGHMSTSTNSNYTGADVMFLQMMIPHHQQAIDISNLAMKVSKDSELLALAKKISADQAAEITQMKAWLKDAGASEDPGHAMDGMGGMLTDADLATLKAATGKDFDILWLKGMTGHHDGAVHMTMMIEDAKNADIKAFGEKVVADQSSQIDQMKAMLARIQK
jgi:uncharacterized protein (DUF305 family)